METLGGLPDGILLTHAHIGHYLGLAQLGREVLERKKGARLLHRRRMARFLRENRPWSRLVALENIEIREVAPGQEFALTPRLRRDRHPRAAPRRRLRHRGVSRPRSRAQGPLAARHRQVGEVGPPPRRLPRRPGADGVRGRHVLLRRRDPRPLDRATSRIPLVPETVAMLAAVPRRAAASSSCTSITPTACCGMPRRFAPLESSGFSVAREGQTHPAFRGAGVRSIRHGRAESRSPARPSLARQTTAHHKSGLAPGILAHRRLARPAAALPGLRQGPALPDLLPMFPSCSCCGVGFAREHGQWVGSLDINTFVRGVRADDRVRVLARRGRSRHPRRLGRGRDRRPARDLPVRRGLWTAIVHLTGGVY